MTKHQTRLTRQYERTDQRCLTDRLATLAGNVENAFIQIGAKPGEDYDFNDLMKHAVKLVAHTNDVIGLVTTEDVEPHTSGKRDTLDAFCAMYIAGREAVQVSEMWRMGLSLGCRLRDEEEVHAWLVDKGWTPEPGDDDLLCLVPGAKP